jgi:hypothetical protein
LKVELIRLAGGALSRLVPGSRETLPTREDMAV